MDGLTDRQTDRLTDRQQTDRRADKQMVYGLLWLGNREGSIKMLKTGVRKKAQPFGLMRAAQDNIWNSRPVLDDSLLATIRNTSSSSSDSSSMHNTQPTTITKSLQT